MKHLIKFNLFEEISPKDINFISTELDKYFTLSFEFEIETDDKSNIKTKFKDLDDDSIDDIMDIVSKDMKIRKRSERDLISGLMYELEDHIQFHTINIPTFDKIFNLDKYSTDREKEIVTHLKNSIVAFVYEEDYVYLNRMIKTHLPNFSRKWDRKLDYVGDATLERGIEIKPKTYLNSLSEAIEMINDFYSDLDNQSYWKFTERTGLHINIGSNQIVEWNPIKGLMLLNDFSSKDVTPIVFKDMTWRMNNRFCGSLIPHLKEMIGIEKDKIKSLDLNNLKESELVLNEFLVKKVNSVGFKNLGFNITKLSHNYCEFRYAGGVISKEVLIEKVKYFSFIVYCMTNPGYKRKEYIKKLYKFLDNL